MRDETIAPTIISTIIGSPSGKSMPVKELRKAVLLSLQLDTDDKSSKKLFKKCVQALEADGRVKLGADGIVKLSKSARKEAAKGSKKKGKKDKKKKRKKSDADESNAYDDSDKKSGKKQKSEHAQNNVNGDDDNDDDEPPMEGDADNDDYGDDVEEDEAADQDGAATNKDDNNAEEDDPANKNKSVKGNPTGVTRLFLGNLPFAVDESSLNDFLGGYMTHVKWITDKETGRFYGSAFVEMRNSKDAAGAVAKAGTELMGRPIKINFAEARSGDIWPPKQRVITGGKQAGGGGGGGGGQAGGYGTKAMSEKPEGCTKLFIGNLSYDIDDDAITKFFASVDAELKAVRWLHHKDSGDFKGVGFVEFWNTEACEKGATLNGKNLLGRPIRIDWTD